MTTSATSKSTDLEMKIVPFSRKGKLKQPKRSKAKKRLAIASLTLAGVISGGGIAAAFDLGGLGGLLDTFAPVLSQYTGMDFTKYASYLGTFQNVLGAVQKGGMKNILGAVGSINQSLGVAGLAVPSELAQSVLDSVTENYAKNGGAASGGVSVSNRGQRALNHAQNVAHRAYIESVLGTEGQENLKKGVEGSADLVKSAAEIAAKAAKSNVSQKKLDAIVAGQVILAAGNAQTYGKLTEIQINGVQQTEIQSGILEYLTHDKTAKTLSVAASRRSSTTASGVFAGLAGASPGSSSSSTAQVASDPSMTGDPSKVNQYFSQVYEPTTATVSTTQAVPKF